MANLELYARTNYFKVKDVKLFETWAGLMEAEIIKGRNGYGLIFIDGVPQSISNENENEVEDFDFFKALSEHLEEGEVAVIEQVGNEKLRYLCGDAWAVNHEGKVVEVGIKDIYHMAAEKFGVKSGKIMEAAY